MIVSWTIRSKQVHVLSGSTMGTSYSVRAYSSMYLPKVLLESAIEEELRLLSKEMSTYDPLSDISVLNATGESEVGFRFRDVWLVSQRVYKDTAGAFDPTIKPLLEAWGVGSDSGFRFPEVARISAALQLIGMENFSLNETGVISTAVKGPKLDFSAVAKGYGVDRVCDVLKQYGIEMAFVEIGGEVRVLGSKPLEAPWKLGLQDPSGEVGKLYGVVELVDRAMATSGDYRQYFEHQGKRYSHIIDPRSGYPVSHNVASVTVLAPTCVEADAYATGFMVMDPSVVLSIVERLDSVEVLILKRDTKDAYTEIVSSGFTYSKLSN